MAPRQGSEVQTIEIHKIFKNLLLQNHMAQVFQIWYVALPCGPLPSLLGSKMAPARGSQVRTIESIRYNI